MIRLYPSKEFRLPITAECISPDVFQDKNHEEIAGLRVYEGNKQKKLGELFKVEEIVDEKNAVIVQGNAERVRRIGASMTEGELIIRGNVGPHLGEKMTGGKITVYGNVGGWAGSMIRGGEIEIHGNAGDYLAAPYRGSNQGMNNGKMVVYGDVGNEAGAHMKKGMIKIYGSSGQFVGFRMHGGTIYVQKDCEGRAGACMINGKIIVNGLLDSMLPTFTIDSIRPRIRIDEEEAVEGPLYVFLGDITEDGRGKLYAHKEKNPHLSSYERLL